MRARLLLAVACLSIFGAFHVAGATHTACGYDGLVSVSVGDTQVHLAKAAGATWIYQESNGTQGLQTGGSTLSGAADPCQHESHDTLIERIPAELP